MGLDMYLTKKTYVKNWKHNEKNGVPEWSVTVKKYGKKYDGLDTSKISCVEQEVITWRKANAIHKWFVDNVQNGDDDCGVYHVETDALKELMGICDEILSKVNLISGIVNNGYVVTNGVKKAIETEGSVIDDPKLCEQLLPSSRGFFFGGTDYDQWYYQTVKNTRDVLKKELEKDGYEDYYYSSSW